MKIREVFRPPRKKFIDPVIGNSFAARRTKSVLASETKMFNISTVRAYICFVSTCFGGAVNNLINRCEI